MIQTILRSGCALTLAAALLACDSSTDSEVRPPEPPDPPQPQPGLSAQITRTSFGIPHIRADDWAGLGYGYGYAYAQDNFCVTMREIVEAGGRSAELMGPEGGNLENDLLFRFLNGSKAEFRARLFDPLPDFVKQLLRGYTAGMNRYLRDTGVENLAEGDAGCRSAPWVFEIDEIDLLQYLRRIALGGSSDQGLIRGALQSVTGPTEVAAAALQELEAPLEMSLQRAIPALRPDTGGSNAVLAGRDATQAGGSVLLGNPHQPWNGSGRWYEAHLTIPGEYDVAGASLQGLPWIGIGFTRDLAWTHTVDFATRFTLYELKLNPNDPLQYEYDGEWRDISSDTVSVLARNAAGELETVEKTFYSSHYGMIVNLESLNPLLGGWPLFNGSLLSIRDANLLTGIRAAEQWIGKAQATDMAGFAEALGAIGNPVFHEFAADRHGDIYYGQVSAVPHITSEKFADCVIGLGALLASGTGNAVIGLDGSRSDCEWGEDPDSPPDTNLFGLASRPTVGGGGTVGNSNNSYWLSDATAPLTGYPVVMGWLGWENMQQFLRTRITHLMIADRLRGEDELSATPLFDLETMKALMYANRVHGAEVALDDTLAICDGYLEAPPAGTAAGDLELLERACDVLDAWDRRVNVDSRGPQVFTEYWRRLRSAIGDDFQNVIDDPDFWLEDFDPQHPLTTPRHIDPAGAGVIELVVDSLIDGSRALLDAGVALDAPWGEVQFLERNGEHVPIHGGDGNIGVFGAISAGLSEGGYRNPTAGNSYIQVVTWDESDCPIADTILTHSQSTDPASPHYGDQTREYADKRWIRFPFCEEDIAAEQIGETLLLEEP